MNEWLPSMYVGDVSLRSRGSSLSNSFTCKQTASRHFTQTE